jgi:hypothetical protein
MKVSEAKGEKQIKQRIRRFYGLFNAAKWSSCYRMVDPALREKLDFTSYSKSLADFRRYYGAICIVKAAKLKVHTNVNGGGYGGRDFASGVLIWLDNSDQPHVFKERWIRDGDHWYTRMAGLVSPDLHDTEKKR